MKIVPTWKQFKGYSIPSKFTIVGVILAILIFLWTEIHPLRLFHRKNRTVNVYEMSSIFDNSTNKLRILILSFKEIQKDGGYDIGYIIKTDLIK